jgi:hypothetical protein
MTKLRRHNTRLPSRAEKIAVNVTCSVLLLLGISPLLFILFLIGNFFQFPMLRCTRISAGEGTCHFVRVSPIQPYYHRFPLGRLEGTFIERESSTYRQRNGHRLVLELDDRDIPLTTYHTPLSSLPDKKLQQAIQAFMADDSAQSLMVFGRFPWQAIVVLMFPVFPAIVGSTFKRCMAPVKKKFGWKKIRR